MFIPIITLIGDVNEPELWGEWSERLTKAGAVLFFIGGPFNWESQFKSYLNSKKVEMSDALFVLNKNGFIKQETIDLINNAIENEIDVFYLEGEDCICKLEDDDCFYLWDLQNSILATINRARAN